MVLPNSTWGISNREGSTSIEIGERKRGCVYRGREGERPATAGEAQRRRLNWHKQWLINIKLTFRTESKRNLNSHTCVIKSAQRPSSPLPLPTLPHLILDHLTIVAEQERVGESGKGKAAQLTESEAQSERESDSA